MLWSNFEWGRWTQRKLQVYPQLSTVIPISITESWNLTTSSTAARVTFW